MKKVNELIVGVLTVVAAMAILTPIAQAIEFEVEIEDFAFVPHGTRINVGDMITWRNRDNVGHTSTSDSGIWNSGVLQRDQTFSFVFTTPGAFPYHCTPHPFMVDTIFVGGQTGADDPQVVPGSFELAQNYPNPFNAQTSISFTLNNSGHASLDIYDVLGRKVATLFSGNLSSGQHSYIWDATNITSGVFFYRLVFNGLTRTGRMTLLK